MNQADDPTGRQTPEPELTRRVSREVLQRIQDHFSALGKITVCICAVDATLITAPTWGSAFSKTIGTSPRGREVFAQRIRSCAEAPSSKVPSICHEGMSFYATPIVYEKTQLATIVVGTTAAQPLPASTVDALADRFEIDRKLLREAAKRIDVHHGGTTEAIHRFADVLAETIATLYTQAEQIGRQVDDLRALRELADLLSGTRELQEILDISVRRVVEIMPVKACAIRLLDVETGELVLKAVHNLSDEYLKKGPVLIHENAIDAAAFAGEAVYVENAQTDPRIRYPENARREGLVSGLCVPMTYRGQTIGVFRVYTATKHLFSESERSLLHSIASQGAATIINSRLHLEQVEAERFQRQVQAASEIQRRMLPESIPQHPGLSFGCVYNPSLQVGGDFYDFIDLANGGLGLCIADVVGKGLPAAIMMSSVRSALRAHAASGRAVDAVVADVNRHLCRDTLAGEFATLVYGVFSSEGRAFTYTNAGHDPPLLLRNDQFVELSAGGLVIGVETGAHYQSETLELREGDTLVLVTDGVTEAMDFHSNLFGRNRLRDSITKYHDLDATQLAQQLLWDVRRFAGLAEQSDDITIVAVKAT